MRGSVDDEIILELYKSSHDNMIRLAFRFLGDTGKAEDLIQSLFLNLLFDARIRAKLINSPNRQGWLMITLKQMVYNEQRKMDSNLLSLDDYHGTPADTLPEPLEFSLPKGLSEPDKQILIWRYEQRLGFREIADKLGIAEASCRSRLSRAVKRCKELMDQENKNF